ncbi:MAG TPA: hypothetical protein VFY14_19455 [Streptomyces sp.]|nr:hypothetical protein [Streptomyces sp.]
MRGAGQTTGHHHDQEDHMGLRNRTDNQGNTYNEIDGGDFTGPVVQAGDFTGTVGTVITGATGPVVLNGDVYTGTSRTTDASDGDGEAGGRVIRRGGRTISGTGITVIEGDPGEMRTGIFGRRR